MQAATASTANMDRDGADDSEPSHTGGSECESTDKGVEDEETASLAGRLAGSEASDDGGRDAAALEHDEADNLASTMTAATSVTTAVAPVRRVHRPGQVARGTTCP